MKSVFIYVEDVDAGVAAAGLGDGALVLPLVSVVEAVEFAGVAAGACRFCSICCCCRVDA